MKRTLLIICTMFTALLTLQAMDRQMEAINAIKKSTDYLYGEATMGTQEEAAKVAYGLLQMEIQKWGASEPEPIDSLTAVGLTAIADTMVLRRADMYRVFAYVRKADLTASQQPQPADTAAVTNELQKKLTRYFRFGKSLDVIQRLMKARNFFDLRGIMEPMKAQGEIADYGKYATAEHPEDCYLIVYDPAGNIKAWLDKGSDVRRNLKTDQDDSLLNYRGCGAIWFKLSEK